MSGFKKSDKIEVSYWKKPSGKNGGLKVPSDKANAILDFWRKSNKETGKANESEDVVMKEKSFKVEVDVLEKKKLKKKVVESGMADVKGEENQQTLSTSSKKDSVNNLSNKDGVDELGKKPMETSSKKSPKKNELLSGHSLVEDEILEVTTEKAIQISPKKSAKTSPKKNALQSGHSLREDEILEVTEKPIKISPKKTAKKSIGGSQYGPTTQVVGTKRKIHEFFEPSTKKIACQQVGSVLGASSSSGLDGLSDSLSIVAVDPVNWKKIVKQDLDLDYGIVFEKSIADEMFQQLEKQTEYYSGDLAKIRVFGKWHNIPRKQVAYGDNGLSYKFSGNCLPAQPWTPFLSSIRNIVEKLTGFSFNFVLINRYKDGCDSIGEHRDDEKDLVANHPIASLSLGQQRDFVLRHALAKNKASNGQHPPSFTLSLEHGSLLVMNPPTNKHWYHSLPVRKGAHNTRINMTFRHMVVK